ncbi:MAG TPA: M12 family metallo-peptidase [Flavobacterium sp.]|nr:M12 family metallo-peptidase [Flavobacterium sp.]
MKKFYTVLALFVFAASFAQGEVAQNIAARQASKSDFKLFNVLNTVAVSSDADISKVVDDATFATINNQAVNAIVATQPDNIEILIPYQGNTISVLLYNVDIYNAGFHLDTDKAKNIPYQKGAHYRGIVNGNMNSVVAMNFFQNEFNGIVSDENLGNLVVAKLDIRFNVSNYIVYSDAKMNVLNGFNCGVKDAPADDDHNHDHDTENRQLSTKCVTTYFEVDYDLFLANNSNETTTANWMTSVFNNVQTLYANDTITIALRSMFIWTEDDPYTGNSSADYLYQFNDVRPVFDGDVGQLVGIDPGGLGGVAVTINGLCTENNFSYSDVNFSYSTVPTFSWTVQVIAHELGHLLGARHTHACVWNGNNTAIDGCGQQAGYTEGSCATGPIPSPITKGTIMSYCHLISGVGINFNNGFGPQPKQAILTAVNTGACLSTDCINTCINTVADIAAINITETSATITWDEQGGATTWQIALMPITGNFASYVPVTAASYDITGLSPNTYYRVRIRPQCSGMNSTYRQIIFATPADWCAGVVITDTGGVNNDHGNLESYVRTLIPTQPNKKIKLVFTSFELEDEYDYLYIYDGASITAPEINAGEGFTGTNSPGTVISTAPDGSLTLHFESDPLVVESGYVANVSCEDNLSVAGYSPDIDFTYYPNPTNGIVNITARTEMSDITVYNIAGQLLYQSKINALDTTVDISSFSTGTYFFKLKFGDYTTNFKIAKM